MPNWQSPPHINKIVYNSNNEQGTIIDLLELDFTPVSFNEDFYNNWISEFSSCYYAVIDWGNNIMSSVLLDSIFSSSPVVEQAPITSEQEILHNWKWHIPFLEGQRVTLNPKHSSYETFLSQSENTNGTIINIDNTIKFIDYWEPTDVNLNIYIVVKWDCGHSNSYPINCLLPITPIITIDSIDKEFKIGQSVTTHADHNYESVYVVGINPYTVDIIFEDRPYEPFKFIKTALTIINTEPIKQITKYDIIGEVNSYYLIEGMINRQLDYVIFKLGKTISRIRPLNYKINYEADF